MVKLASNIGFYTVADSPFTFVFQSLGMDVFKCIDSGFYFAGDADNEGVWRNDLIFQDKGTGTVKKLFVDDVDSLEVLLATPCRRGSQT